MTKNSLETFIEEVKAVWRPINTQTVSRCRQLLSTLAQTPATEPWLAHLRSEDHLNRELYRDAEHGFVLLAHTETKNLYRVPHDHGAGWVVYAVQSGEMEMGTYRAITNQKGETHLVCRDFSRLHAGDCHVYLPQDIHDTRCISENVLMFRLSSCDLKTEDREGRMVRYVNAAFDFRGA